MKTNHLAGESRVVTTTFGLPVAAMGVDIARTSGAALSSDVAHRRRQPLERS